MQYLASEQSTPRVQARNVTRNIRFRSSRERLQELWALEILVKETRGILDIKESVAAGEQDEQQAGYSNTSKPSFDATHA
jgi:hypothetical protein